MRRVLTVLLVAVALVATLAPPILAQTSKVTINGLVDATFNYAENTSNNDQSYTRRERDFMGRMRARPDIVGELGTTKFVLGLEFDYTYGQIASNRDQAADDATAKGSQRFGITSGSTMNTDITRLVEVKWAYTEFDVPWIPMTSRMRLGAQPWDVTYKTGVHSTGDFPGGHLSTTLAPQLKLNMDYAFIEDRATGR